MYLFSHQKKPSPIRPPRLLVEDKSRGGLRLPLDERRRVCRFLHTSLWTPTCRGLADAGMASDPRSKLRRERQPPKPCTCACTRLGEAPSRSGKRQAVTGSASPEREAPSRSRRSRAWGWGRPRLAKHVLIIHPPTIGRISAFDAKKMVAGSVPCKLSRYRQSSKNFFQFWDFWPALSALSSDFSGQPTGRLR